MKKKSVSFLFLFLASSLVSCTTKEPLFEDKKVTITFVESPYYELEKSSYEVTRGEDLKVELSFTEGFAFESCSYTHYVSQAEENGSLTLILQDVLYPTRVELTCRSDKSAIVYNTNGGTYYSKEFTKPTFIRYYDLSKHPRANTERGVDYFYRDGYVQTGWNTAKDGSGIHIGLGSRCEVTSGQNQLYAEWEKESDASLFEKKEEQDGYVLTKFLGQGPLSKLVIPRKIDNKPVIGIASGFLSNTTIDSLVLSENIRSIASLAFDKVTINTLTFSDSLVDVYGDSFRDGYAKKVRINAFFAPKYQGSNDNAQFSEDIEHLLQAKGKKKLLLYGGCSMSYGMNSKEVEESYPGYKVINLGVIGGTNASFAFDIFPYFVEKGDIFLHAPEVASGYQLMAKTDAESRMFIEVEGNYDLMSYADISSIPGFFHAFHSYQNARLKLPSGSYEDVLANYNEYGDIQFTRPNKNMDAKFTAGSDYTYMLDYTKKKCVDALAKKYQAIEAKGVKVYFSFAPTNLTGLPESDVATRVWETFEKNMRENLSTYSIDVISHASDYLYPGRFFYDTDYHLNDSGVEIRTSRLIRDLGSVL